MPGSSIYSVEAPEDEVLSRVPCILIIALRVKSFLPSIYIQTPKCSEFIKGKRTTGFFPISDLEGNVISPSVNVKKDCTRLNARTTTLIERRNAPEFYGLQSYLNLFPLVSNA